ncbi:MAG: 2'-5' RNA ligase [Balneola sp.]|jgi:2'-5' RNA ligase|nr:2'-5' RNA ligase [Balneola sp.]MBE78026.1 2'-5' RNA ligase [Balneola sp.]|tara:strand:+ start:2547 stop:3089 length:543 start_codon:yes stop_codon:yes gene_type:complete
MNQLYFIALIPPSPLKDEIQELKLEVKEKFKSSHSLNAPPHITLLSPFRLEDEDTNQLSSLLEAFIQKFEPVEVHLNNFSTFPPRVVFIDVEQSPQLMEVQEKLEALARSHSELFNYNYAERPYHPHVTLAFKDLTKSNFYKAWEEFENREFKGSFKANTLSVLKHNGESWKVIETFSLK